MGAEQSNAEPGGQLVLVTGGGGFIGTRTVQQLRSAGHPVVVLDDGSGGTLKRVDQLATDTAVRVHRVDLRDRDSVAVVCQQQRPWAVVHLAGRHFMSLCESHPEETWQVNVDGTRNLLRALAACPPHRLLFASTADVYRESTSPHMEDDPLGPSTVYGRSKVAAEQLLRESVSGWGTSLVIARLFNLYGRHDTVAHLIPAIVAQAVDSGHLLLGDLTTVRDFVHVDDAASAVVELVTRALSGTYNIGTGTATSGERIVELVAKLLGRDLTMELDPRRLRSLDRRILVADPTKLSALLPWWPATPLDEGLEDVINSHSRIAVREEVAKAGAASEAAE